MRSRLAWCLLSFYALPMPLVCGALGCGSVHQLHTPFDELEYAPYARKGEGAISGQVLLRTHDGDFDFAVGRKVTLTPVTRYSEDWYQQGVARGRAVAPPDPRARRFDRQTTTDERGAFEFVEVPAGEFFLICNTMLRYDSANRASIATDRAAHARLALEKGRRARIVLQN